jgi:hypothetical protein
MDDFVTGVHAGPQKVCGLIVTGKGRLWKERGYVSGRNHDGWVQSTVFW